MTTPHESADLHLNIGGYALDALDPADRAAFEAHLAACPSCRNELAGMAETTGLLAASQRVTPPARLRSNVLAAIAITPQLAPLTSSALEQPAIDASPDAVPPGSASGIAAAADAPGSAADAAPTTEHPASNVIAMTRRRAPTATRLLAAAAAVLALVAGGLGWRNATLSNNLQQAQVTAAEVTSVLTARDAKTTTTAVKGGGSAAIVSSASLDQAVLVADNMAPAPAGHVYQLWLISASGDARAAGFLDPNSVGQGAEVLAGSINQAKTVGVTIEPAGGSTSPTTNPIMAVPA
jgi:anti-sigma factor RsiW